MTQNQSDKELLAEILCAADTFWVLGHWYIKVMMNGRSLQDFNAISGFTQDSLGFTRALFRYAEEEFDLPEYQLEFGRDRDAIHSMDILDEPPQSWGDLLVSAYLATTAVVESLSSLASSEKPGLAAIATQIKETAYFHQMYLDGWASAATAAEKEQIAEALEKRLPSVFQWFSDDAGRMVSLADSGHRNRSLEEEKAAFHQEIGNLTAALSIEPPALGKIALPNDWDAQRRRRSKSLPASLWEMMLPQSEAAKLGRRPLAVSIEDNVDLF